MIRSMTAFARHHFSYKGKGWNFELRSVNQRFFELSLRIPNSFLVFENQIRELSKKFLTRGKVSLTISEVREADSGTKFVLNQDQVEYYLKASKKVKRDYGIDGDLQIADIISLAGVFKETSATNDDVSLSWSQLQKAMTHLLKTAKEVREIEGKKLEVDIRGRLQKIKQVVDVIRKSSANNEKRWFQTLKEKVTEISKISIVKDDERLLREIAYMAEKCDITEELVRMKSHVELFEKTLNTGQSVGRELDFICQEMNREINTMASKAQLFKVSRDVVTIKSELEKIREQVQNVE